MLCILFNSEIICFTDLYYQLNQESIIFRYLFFFKDTINPPTVVTKKMKIYHILLIFNYQILYVMVEQFRETHNWKKGNYASAKFA